jgi:hypothetical protein
MCTGRYLADRLCLETAMGHTMTLSIQLAKIINFARTPQTDVHHGEEDNSRRSQRYLGKMLFGTW